MNQVGGDDSAFLVAAGKALAAQIGSEFNRLKAVLGRIS
jgi:hypothetical protein